MISFALTSIFVCALFFGVGFLLGARDKDGDRDRARRLVQAFGVVWAGVVHDEKARLVHDVFMEHAPELHDEFHEAADVYLRRPYRPRPGDLQ